MRFSSKEEDEPIWLPENDPQRINCWRGGENDEHAGQILEDLV